MLNNSQMDALKELINIGLGKGAQVLNEMLNSHIQLQLPMLEIIAFDKLTDFLSADYSSNLSGIYMDYQGEMNGNVVLIFNTKDALKLVSAFLGSQALDGEFDEMKSGSLCEIGNITINAVIGTLSNILKMRLKYSVPSYLEGGLDYFTDRISLEKGSVILVAKTKFLIRDLEINGYIMLFFTMNSFARFIESIDLFIGEKQ